MPVAVAPLLRASVQAPVAVTLPEIVALTPAHRLLLLEVMAAVGRAFTVTRVLPVMPADTALHLVSVKDAIVYVVVAEGVTEKLKVVLPVPVVVAPLLKVNVHAPEAVTFPAIVVAAPAQTAVLALVMAAVGRVLSETAVLPVNPADTALHFVSVSDERV